MQRDGKLDGLVVLDDPVRIAVRRTECVIIDGEAVDGQVGAIRAELEDQVIRGDLRVGIGPSALVRLHIELHADIPHGLRIDSR